MKLNFKYNVPALICVILLICIQFSKILAQDNFNIKEPPVPVYIISPYHEDSLSATYEGSIRSNGPPYINTIKKLDTLQQQVQKSSAESTVHFIWLYSLVALLGIMNIVLLFSVSRIRKELAQMKRFEHNKILLTPESSAISQPTPTIQETSFNREPPKIQPSMRTRKSRTMKSRVKNRKKI
jgi:hypothetical protein